MVYQLKYDSVHKTFGGHVDLGFCPHRKRFERRDLGCWVCFYVATMMYVFLFSVDVQPVQHVNCLVNMGEQFIWC